MKRIIATLIITGVLSACTTTNVDCDPKEEGCDHTGTVFRPPDRAATQGAVTLPDAIEAPSTEEVECDPITEPDCDHTGTVFRPPD